jgi:DNA mismatch repair protein MutS2
MAFAVGDLVHVPHFGKGIVLAVRNAGRLLVEVKGRSMVVAASQVTPVDARGGRQSLRPPAADGELPGLPSRGSVPDSIDLHGLTSDQATEALDEFLNDALLAGLPIIRIIHGRSGGRLKDAVHRRLKQVPSVRSFHVDPRNPGVTIASL